MKTDELINVIAHDAGMPPVPMARRLLVAMAGSFVLAALALMATIGVRPASGLPSVLGGSMRNCFRWQQC